MAAGVPLAFSVSYDLTTKVISACIWVVPLIAAFVVVRQNATARLVVGGSLLLIGLAAYAYSPRVYAVSAEGITVWRPIGMVRVPLETVREVRPATGEDLAGCIRLWSSGGLFGYDGLYRTAKPGQCRWYVADRSRVVVLVTAAETALFSPDDPNGFAKAIRAAAAHAPVDSPQEWPATARYPLIAMQ
jgi:Bacterial PH domain